MKKMHYYLLIDKKRCEVIFGSTSPNACEKAYLESIKNGMECKISHLDCLGEFRNKGE